MEPGDPLRIVSYNVRYFGHALRGLASTDRAKHRIAHALASLSPLADVVCLQEVETQSLRSRISPGDGAPTQLDQFLEHLTAVFQARGEPMPYEAFYFRAHAYRIRTVPVYTTGLAILVHVGTVRVAHHNKDQPEDITHHHLKTWARGKQSRICAHLKLVTGDDRTFHVFNTHLSLPTPWARAFWSQRDKMGFGVNQVHEARALAQFVQRCSKDEPFVVCGDFNSAPTSPVYRFLTEEAGFKGAQACIWGAERMVPGAFPTAGFMRLRMQIDHLFSGGCVQWVDLADSLPFGRGGAFDGLSDHVPLIARFRLNDG